MFVAHVFRSFTNEFVLKITVHLPNLVNSIPFPPHFSTKIMFVLLLALHHVMWRLLLENLFWKSPDLTNLLENYHHTDLPFLCKIVEKVILHKIFPISKKTTSAIPFSQPVRQYAAPRLFWTLNLVMSLLHSSGVNLVLSLLHSNGVNLVLSLLHSSGVNLILSLLHSSGVNLVLSLLHSSGVSHISQIPVPSATYFHHHHISCFLTLPQSIPPIHTTP